MKPLLFELTGTPHAKHHQNISMAGLSAALVYTP